MEHYQLLKYAHLIPAVLILAGFIAHCFMLWKANKGGDAAVLTRKLRVTRLYSLPALGVLALSLPISGWWLVHTVGLPLGASWLLYSAILFALLMLFGLLLHGRLGAWQAAVGGAVPVKLLRFVIAYGVLVLVLLLAIFALMGAKPA
ncbi:DUF2269 family protein [Aquipseudomonas guryensis]|jgi:uncharacterized membrane protein|uniref:DUF2269 family protein n=1 Tax=Aquipseudomonas guryensis TaxID=2759165 RepID=A0A7W4DA93_9GAMM|nr:DUF2269 family protein [Pseudomonas guryensis]MBB1518838.1 DUF2269 family protein [Pseudomonas guryensis]